MHRLHRGPRSAPVVSLNGAEHAGRAGAEPLRPRWGGGCERVGGHRQGERLDVSVCAGEELPVAGGKSLALGRAVEVELLAHDCSLHRAMRAGDRPANGLHGDLLEDDARHVLGPEDVAEAGVRGHDHRRGTLPAGEPRALGSDRVSVQVVDHVLAQVPDRSIVGLGVAVASHLLQAAVTPGHVLREQHLDATAVPGDGPDIGQQRGLGAKRTSFLAPEEHGRAQA